MGVVVELLVDVEHLARRRHAAVLLRVRELRVLEGAERRRRVDVLVGDLPDALDRLGPGQRDEPLEVRGDVAARVEHAAGLGARHAELAREVPQHARERADLPEGQRRAAREQDALRERGPAARRAHEEHEVAARGRVRVREGLERARRRVGLLQAPHERRVAAAVVARAPVEEEPVAVRARDVRPGAVPEPRGLGRVAAAVADLGDLVLGLREAEARVRPHVERHADVVGHGQVRLELLERARRLRLELPRADEVDQRHQRARAADACVVFVFWGAVLFCADRSGRANDDAGCALPYS